MAGGGPASLRLQDIAREAGVSHPTILHHFGSREGLVRALNLRALETLTHRLVAGMGAAQAGEDGIAQTFAAYRGGMAERLVWLLASNTLPEKGPSFLNEIVDSLHTIRKRFASPGHEPDIEDTRFVVHLTAIAAMGDALMGSRLRQAGEDEVQLRTRFERWYAALIDEFLRART